MPRGPRIHAAGGIYHVTARGNRRAHIFRCEQDLMLFLRFLSLAADRHGWRCWAYCLLPNHFHLVLETPLPNLSLGMQWLNGTYASWFNDRHGLTGHVFQGRFHAVLVETDSHALELARYVVLNPVRAGLCEYPGEWRWSSYAGTVGTGPSGAFVAVERLLEYFGSDQSQARRTYRAFVGEGMFGAAMSGVRPGTWPFGRLYPKP